MSRPFPIVRHEVYNRGIDELEESVDRGPVPVGGDPVGVPQRPVAAQPVEPLVVLAGHVDVDVVVPGDEPLVAQGAEQRAVGEEVRQPVGLAHPVQLAQGVQLDLLDLLQGERTHSRPFP